MTPGESLLGMDDEDLKRTMLAALRLLAVFAAVCVVGFWWAAGWQSAVLLAVGAVISGASLWEWMRLMTAVMERMAVAGEGAPPPRPIGLVLTGFVLRLGLTLVVLYGSLRYLHGTAIALAVGLGLGVLALTVEAVRLLGRWNT